jgi:hypothetical protein
MGAEFDYFVSSAKTKADVKEEFDSYCDNAAYEDGHSYSGRLNMCNGLEFHDKVLDSEDEAYEYVDSVAQKWENAVAVQFKDGKSVKWFIGGVCSS